MSSTTPPLPTLPEGPVPARLRPEALGGLRALDPVNGEAFVARVLQTYRRSLDRYLPELEAALNHGDVANARMIVHSLKSSSLQIGADDFGQLCAAIEQRLVSAGAIDAGAVTMLADLFVRVPAVRRSIDAEIGPEAAR